MTRVPTICAVLLCCATSCAAAAEPLLTRAQTLIDTGEPAAALVTLGPHMDQRAGEPEFDYLLALAMLDSGDSAGATLVFERLLLVAPNFHGARIDLGRAYLQQGKLTQARREFETARAAAPPAVALQAIDRYLARITRTERRAKFSHYLSVGTRAGYDTNVNSATQLDEFLGFALDARSREQSSDFFEAHVAGGGAYAVRPHLTLSGRLSTRWRRNAQASFADSNVTGATARLARRDGRQEQSLSVQAFGQVVDGRRNSTAVVATGEWRFNLNNSWWVAPQVQFGTVRFEDALEIKDINRWSAGVSGGLRFGSLDQGALQTSLSVGHDDPQRDGSRFGRNLWRLDASLNWTFSDVLNGALGAGMERSDYDNVFFATTFSETREDTAYRARAALDWQFARRWRLQHTLNYRLNETDVTVFEFERFEATLGLRYVWY